MKNVGSCTPCPGLFKATGCYAVAHGVMNPHVLVDPAVRCFKGNNALVAHEMCHVESRHALKYVLAIVTGCLLIGGSALYWIAQYAGVTDIDGAVDAVLALVCFLWFYSIPVFLRDCEIEADKYALERTTPGEFVAFLYMHPHPKGRWGRWLYGHSISDRIQRVLPNQEG